MQDGGQVVYENPAAMFAGSRQDRRPVNKSPPTPLPNRPVTRPGNCAPSNQPLSRGQSTERTETGRKEVSDNLPMKVAVVSMILVLASFCTMIGLHFQQQSEWKKAFDSQAQKLSDNLEDGNRKYRKFENQSKEQHSNLSSSLNEVADQMRIIENNSEEKLSNLSNALSKANDRIGRVESKSEGISAGSCSELRDSHGISANGYYWITSPLNEMHFAYCDFHAYEDVSSCADLRANHNITKYGYYLLGTSPQGFRYCPDLYTCHQLVQLGHVTKSGSYKAGPPGENFNVHCNLDSSIAITEIMHYSMHEIQASACEAPGCYTHRPKYTSPMDSIVKVTEHSDRCRQFIKFRCKHAVMFHSGSAHWLSRNQEKMTYWGGATSRRSGYCACGETGTCVNTNYKCNCDSNTDTITSDEGFLTDKSKLPVLEMAFGDMGNSNEVGWHTLGKLECMG